MFVGTFSLLLLWRTHSWNLPKNFRYKLCNYTRRSEFFHNTKKNVKRESFIKFNSLWEFLQLNHTHKKRRNSIPFIWLIHTKEKSHSSTAVTTKQFPTLYGTTVHTFQSFYCRSIVISSFGLLLLSFKWSLPFSFSHLDPLRISSPSHSCHIPCTTYHLSLDESDNILTSRNNIDPMIIQFSSAKCHFLPLKSKYAPQLHVLQI